MLKHKNKLVNNIKNFYKGREKTIEGFKNKVFPLYCNEAYEWNESSKRNRRRRKKREKKKNKRQKKKKEIFPIEFDDETKQEKQKEQKSI